MRLTIITLSALVTLANTTPLGAQATRDSVDKTFFTKGDLVRAGVIVGSSALVSVFDERIARWTQSPHIQGDSSRQDLAKTVTVVNEAPLTIAAVAVYGIGRLAGNETVADVGLHVTESLVLTVGLSEIARISIGRIRPRAASGNAFSFEPGEGLKEFEARSYPSIHAAVAFATASALIGEVRVRHPEATKYATPVLYTAALVPGFTRLYLNQHWASDVVAGTLLGAMLGSRVVGYAHSHRRNWLDRALLHAAVLPSGDGTVMISASFGWPGGGGLQ